MMIEISNSLKLNEIHSPFNADPKNIIFSREVLISGEGRSENLAKWAITGISIAIQIGGWSISKENINLYPLVPKSL